MKVSKTAAATARRLFGLCQTNGRLDESKLRAVVSRLVDSKVRDYRGILTALHRLVRIEGERRKVVVESAAPLDANTQARITSGLSAKYGADLDFHYAVTPGLLGGLRIQVGDDVFDGSVKGRIDRFAASF